MFEFALVLPVLLALVIGIFQFSRAYNVYQTITRAAREGARLAVLPSAVYSGNRFLDSASLITDPASSAVFAQAIAPSLQASSLNPKQVANYREQVGWLNPGGAQQQCGVAISFDYPFLLNIPFTGERFRTLTLHTRVQMWRENQPVAGGSCP
jgi:Flp pilus assembly protein TadG